MANVTLVCPNLKCKAVLEVSDKMRGQRVRCNKCGQVIVVPAKSAKPK
jgi:predicted Zn finger-like uncharacterized protein